MYRNVKAELTRNGLTGMDLAKELNLSPSAVSSKLNGKVTMTFSEAVKIKDFLNADMTMEELFEFYNKTAAI